MRTIHSQFAIRIEKVLEKRKTEFEEVKVLVCASSVDLRSLWLTPHGFSVLKAAKLGTKCSIFAFENIKLELEKNNFTLHTSPRSLEQFPSKMSE